jgi:hypothetical protein
MPNHGIFDWMVEATVPFGGAVVIFAEVYVDESGTHDGSPMLTVAGYLFEREQARKFSRDWQKVLDKYGLPAAHMTDAVRCEQDYKKAGMELADCDKCNRLLIENIKRRTRLGFGASVDPAAYARIVGTANNAPSAYTYALQSCFVMIRRWAAETNFEGDIAYFFEAGHASQSEADRYFRAALLASERAKAKNHYAGHAFLDKRKALPLQAADMLAWQYHHYHARKAKCGISTRRADFSALLRPHDVCTEHRDEELERFRDMIVNAGWLVGRY